MAKIPFDIKYRPQIESGEYRVETQAGCPVRIVCWDMACEFPILGLVLLNDEKAEEMAVGFTNEGANLLGEPLYDKLFIVTTEEELTEFEKKLWEVLKSEGSPIGPIEKFTDSDKDVFHSYAAELLALAREELFANDTVLKEYAQVSREQGKAEALKDLPRWKKDESFETEGTFMGVKGRECFVVKDGYSISVAELIKKLPGFKED